MKKMVMLFASIMIVSTAIAQMSKQQIDSMKTLTDEDYRSMLAQLRIDSLRAGPSGNPKAPNAANADESKATQYTSLPDPLVMNSGEKVLDAGYMVEEAAPRDRRII